MPKRRDFRPNDKELRALIVRDGFLKRPEVVNRAMALRLLHWGYCPEKVADILVVTASSVYNWWRRWESEGGAGLANSSKSGRPRKTDAHYCQQLADALECDPGEYGYRFTIWTTDRLRAHLERITGMNLGGNAQSIYDMLKKRVQQAGVKDLSQDFQRTFVGDMLAGSRGRQYRRSHQYQYHAKV